MKFSQRIGAVPIRTALQKDSIDHILTNRLWNDLRNNFFLRINEISDSYYIRNNMCMNIWENFYHERTDEIYLNSDYDVDYARFLNHIKKWWLHKAKWYDKYDFLEFLISDSNKIQLSFHENIKHSKTIQDYNLIRKEFIEQCNNTLKNELAAYRLVDYNVVQITSEEEILEIEEAIASSNEYVAVNIHLKSALRLLSNRTAPDYRNSIKESISAVESLCSIVVKKEKATLGQTLTKIEKNYGMHKAMKSAFASLYGFTSDAGGIRHALLEDDIEIKLEDAKFMLISCSAFINYLKAKI